MSSSSAPATCYHWGPYLHRTRIPEAVCTEILSRAELARKDHSANLAGVIEREYLFDERERQWLEALLVEHLWGYAVARAVYHNQETNVASFRLDEVWINIMQPGEFNPPHNHFGGDIAFVLYLRTPPGLEAEFRSNRRNNSGPGAIEFCYGQPDWWVTTSHVVLPQVGDLLIFPAPLLHFVQPYTTPGERVSVAGNVQSSPSVGLNR